MKKWISDVKQYNKRLAIPIMTHPGIDLIGRSVYDAVTDGTIHFSAIKALNKKYPAAALHFINKLDIVAALEQVPKTTLVLGNLDPAAVFKLALPPMVYDITIKTLSDTTLYRNFIISSGCEVPPGVHSENINAFYNALADFNNHSYRNK